jgi:hypothetical protein
MAVNNFKELESQIIEERGSGDEDTKSKVNSNIVFINFISTLIDLYLPKVGDVLKSMAGENDAPNKISKK